MFGPKFEIPGPDQTVVLREILPRDTASLPYHVSTDVVQYLSEESRQQVHELISWGSGSKLYEWQRDGADRVTWGQYITEGFTEKLVGYTGFDMVRSPEHGIDARWQQVESYMVILNRAYIGKGIAAQTHPYRSVFGFSLGVDCFWASVVDGNERSRRALLRAGYVELGRDPALDNEGCHRTDFRLYSPELAELAIDHAMAHADQRKNRALTPDIVRLSQELVHDLRQSLPGVQDAAKAWLEGRGRNTLFVSQSA